jgi:Ca2+-binding EF-hand superfamily protein
LISSEEIKEVLGFGKTLREEAVNEIIKQVDENGDGQISFEEFAAMMRKLQE